MPPRTADAAGRRKEIWIIPAAGCVKGHRAIEILKDAATL